MATKFCGAITVPTGGWDISVDAGGGGETATLAAGTYYLSGDSSATDLLETLETAIDTAITADGAGAGAATVTMSAAGICSIVLASGTATLTWTDTALRDILRYDDDGASTSLSDSAATGHRCCRYFVASSYPVVEDVPTTEYRRSMDESDDGTIHSLVLSPQIRRYRIGIRYQGPHRKSTFTEYHAWQGVFRGCHWSG